MHHTRPNAQRPTWPSTFGGAEGLMGVGRGRRKEGGKEEEEEEERRRRRRRGRAGRSRAGRAGNMPHHPLATPPPLPLALTLRPLQALFDLHMPSTDGSSTDGDQRTGSQRTGINGWSPTDGARRTGACSQRSKGGGLNVGGGGMISSLSSCHFVNSISRSLGKGVGGGGGGGVE